MGAQPKCFGFRRYSYQWLFQSGVNVTQSAFQNYELSHRQQSRLVLSQTYEHLDDAWALTAFFFIQVPWVGYAPYVTSAQRAEWEAENQHPIVQNSAMGGSQPFWPSGSFAPQARAAADSYFPTLLVPSMTDWLIGFDVLSDPAAQLVAFDAIHTGRLSVGPKMDIDLATGTDQVHRFVLPYYGQNGTNDIQGIIHGVFVAHTLLEQVYNSTTQNVTLGIQILDSSAGNIIPNHRRVVRSAFIKLPLPIVNGLSVAGAQRIQPSSLGLPSVGAHIAQERPFFHHLLIISIFTVFILLFCIAAALLSRICILRHQSRKAHATANALIDSRITERQVDWMRTNAFSILNAIRDPLLIIDREGYVIDVNDDALVATKYRVEDLIFGIHISTMFPGITSGKNKDKAKEKHTAKVSHPPGGWSISCPPSNEGSPNPDRLTPPRNENVVIDVESTYLDLPEAPQPEEIVRDETIITGMQELTLKTKEGREHLVEANFSPFIDCQDQKEKIQIVLFRDVSAWKNIIKETGEAKDRAELSRNEISDYLAFVCHELRNPLHVIIGLSTLLNQSIQALASSHSGGVASSTPASPAQTMSPSSNEGSEAHMQMVQHDAVEHLAGVAEATRIMKTILNDTHMLSKVESGTVDFETCVVDLRSLLQRIHRAQESYKDSFSSSSESLPPKKPSDVEFKLVLKGLSEPSSNLGQGEGSVVGLGMTDVSPDMPVKEWFPPVVKTDSTRLTQVLTNLVTNAFEHTVTGSVTLRAIVENVRLYDAPGSPRPSSESARLTRSLSKIDANKPKKQALIRFEVEDTGRGIAKAVMPKLFKMYSQNSVDRALGSTGLSLNVTYALLALMGAELQAFSTVGQGTTVWFSLWFDLPDDVLEESDDEFKSWTGGSQFISDVFLGRRDSIYTPPLIVKPKKRTSHDKGKTRSGSRSPRSPSFHKSSPDVGPIRSSAALDHPADDIVDAPPALPEPPVTMTSSPLAQPSISIPRSTSSTKPALVTSRILSTEAAQGHLPTAALSSTSSALRPNTVSLRRSSQGEQRKPSKLTRKAPNPAARRLGTHPLKDRPIRVLVVEDNEVLLKIAGTTLARAGFEVKQAINGEQAIQRVVEMGEKYFDVVLMDLLMPVMDGFQATEEIRRRGWTMPVIALTAKTLESDRLRCFKIGFNYFMTKPFQLGDIATVIRFMVGAEAEQKAAQAAVEGTPNQPTYGGPWSKFT
ncbi:hypothetical protein HDU87_005101 [Geranomyces variabilis]|uniref:Histidine kinase n=1 Tax=Geranomyces variabilis TaxID=109894 RepID=A0AAD5TQH7_9FUNG|nr:hypothetical protein HDU87_005101 [Geranomyces variabilis]